MPTSEGRRTALRFARVAWGAAVATGALLMALVLPPAALARWLPLLAAPAAAGAWALRRPAWVRGGEPALAGAVAAIALAACAVLAAHAFGALAATLLVVWVAAPLLLVAAYRPAALEGLLVSAATGAATLAVTVLLAEQFLRRPAVAARLGTPQELAAWEERYDRLWTRNVLGYRTPHEQVRRDSATLRVVALGDSFTWGDKIASSDSTWPARLEALLRADAAWERVEVVNLARNGFTAANEAEMLRRLGWQFEPDAVVLQFFVNDVLPSGPDFRFVDTRMLTPPRRLLPLSLRRGAADSSALLALLERRWTLLRAGGSEVERWGPLYADSSQGWQQLRAAYREVAAASRERGVPVLLVLFPYFVPGEWTTRTYPLRDLHERVRAEAEAAGLTVLDLTPEFARVEGDWTRWWATPYDAHPSVEAHALAARAVHDAILAQWTARHARAAPRPNRG